MPRIFVVFILNLFSVLSFQILAQGTKVGADNIPRILELTQGKRVGITSNHTGILSNDSKTALVDTLLRKGVHIIRLFSPEHGFRGTEDAGAHIPSTKDKKTGLPIISLYGKSKEPSPKSLSDIDIMLFDLQDVGARFFTYSSTLYYVMEACKKAATPLVVLDRPNPHDYIDGPVLKDQSLKSFVGLFPIPVLHGLTMGELALMIKGEKWLSQHNPKDTLHLTIVPCSNWKHGDPYLLPVPPSPNLRSTSAILYYPTLCFLEGTNWSVGRGTETPFQEIGYPNHKVGKYIFTPTSKQGALNPKHKEKKCYTPFLLRHKEWNKGINLSLLLELALITKNATKSTFVSRPQLFDLLAGTRVFQKQIENNFSPKEIKETWKKDLISYKQLRHEYLLYPDTRQFFSNDSISETK